MKESQFTGCIVGLAIGDALGYPAEFRRRAQLLEEIGPEGITDFIALQDARFSRPHFVGPAHPPGTYTDDTQMTVAVAEALLAAGHCGFDELMTDLGHRFVKWSESAENNRAPGGTCMEGCRNLVSGVAWHEAGVPGSKGCGSAMRVAPIGLFYQDLDQVAETARASSLLTHGHPTALDGAAAGALMVALALRGAKPDAIFAEVDRRCSAKCSDFAATWQKLPDLITQPPPKVLVEGALGEGWVAEEAVASAMYCFWRHPDDFERAVLTAINTDGDSDSIGTITGSVLGARLGIDAIPRPWRDGVEDSEYLHDCSTPISIPASQSLIRFISRSADTGSSATRSGHPSRSRPQLRRRRMPRARMVASS
jgi:ADP-ribosylglycohydrolase